jgi:non-specific protein-tyrosine kinase
MKLAPYLRVLWRWKWIIVATLVTTVAVAMIGTLRAEPVYTVTATLRMRTTSGGSVDWVSYDINYAERLMNTYAIIATSGPMLNQLEVDLEGDLPDHVEAEVVPETELMRIRVDDTDPALASDAANRLAAMLVTLSKGEGTGERKPVVDVLKERLDELDAELKQARDEYRELVGQNPGDPERLTVVSQSIELKEEIYTSLLRQYEDARIREAIQVNSLSLVDPATPPSSPARPRMVINLGLGILGGLGAGLGLAVILEKFTVVSEAGDLEDIYRD